MPAKSTTPGLGAVACTPYGGALPSDHVSSMTLTETQMRLPCGQWNSFATSTSLTSLTEDGAAGRERDDFWSSHHPLSLAPLDPRIRNDLGPSFDLGAHAFILEIGRQCLRDESDLAEFCFHVLLRQNLGRGLANHLEGGVRCARGRIKRVPRRNLEVRHACLGHGRNIRKLIETRGAC